MPNVREVKVLLVGSIVEPFTLQNVWRDGKATDEVKGKKVLIRGAEPFGGMSYVTVPIAQDGQAGDLAIGAPVVWWVEYGAWGRSGGEANTSCRFIAAADENAAQLVHETRERSAGVGAGRRSA